MAHNSSKHVLVVGDAMLDLYWSGSADRLSPEAPVPVIGINRIERRLGGASNVALNLASLGTPCALASLIGNDEPGRYIESELLARGVRTVLHQTDHPTIQKIRLLARNQQIARVDFEEFPFQGEVKAFTKRVVESLDDVGIAIFSDYAKGSLFDVSTLIAECRKRKIPVFVDPKGDSFDRYAGATLITPNKAELRRVVGSWRTEAELREKAQNLRECLGLEKLLLTRSEEGMTLFDEQGAFTVKANAREVFDVSGAGDTVIAVLAATRLDGLSWKQAVTLANKAGGIVVGKLGTATVTREEVLV